MAILDIGDARHQHDVLGHLVAPGLELQDRQPIGREGRAHGAGDRVDVAVDRGQLVQRAVARVARRDHEDAIARGEAAAAVDPLDGDAERPLDPLCERADLAHHVAVVSGLDLDRVVAGHAGEGEVVVQAAEAQARRVADVGDHALGLPRSDRNAELPLPDLQGRLVARIVREQLGVAKLQPHDAVGHVAGRERRLVEPLGLAERVDVDLADAELGREAERRRALAVPVQHEVFGRRAAHQRDLQLGLAGAVEAAADALQRAHDLERVVRLDRVVALDLRVARLPRIDEAPVVVLDATQRGDPERRAESTREIVDRAAVEIQPPVAGLHQLGPVHLACDLIGGRLIHCHLTLPLTGPDAIRVRGGAQRLLLV